MRNDENIPVHYADAAPVGKLDQEKLRELCIQLGMGVPLDEAVKAIEFRGGHKALVRAAMDFPALADVLARAVQFGAHSLVSKAISLASKPGQSKEEIADARWRAEFFLKTARGLMPHVYAKQAEIAVSVRTLAEERMRQVPNEALQKMRETVRELLEPPTEQQIERGPDDPDPGPDG